MKKLNPIAKCVIVLSSIVFICAGLLIAANKLLYVSDEVRLGRSLSKLLSNTGAVTLYDIDDTSKNEEITAFNADAPARERIDGRVLRVYLIKDDKGTNDGKYVIEAEGRGYKSNSVSLIAFNPNGTVYGVVVKSYGAVEDRMSNFSASTLSDKIKAASAANQAAGDIATKIESSIMPATNATNTVDGILRATNIASLFFKEVILQIGPTLRDPVELVTDSMMIDRLNALLALDGQISTVFYEFPNIEKIVTTFVSSGSGSLGDTAEIITAYIGNNNQLIMRLSGRGYADDGGTYGFWDILALMGDNNRIQAVYAISKSAQFEDGEHGVLAQLSNAYLTSQLKDKDESYFQSSQTVIFEGGVTESTNGIKVVAYLAVSECGYMRSQVEEILDEYGLPQSAAQALFAAKSAKEER